MAKALSAAQKRAITSSDPATGRLSARADVCAALAAGGLAVPHGRSGHHSYYLSREGLLLRAELAAARPEQEPNSPSAPGTQAESEPPVARPDAGSTFAADDGTSDAPPGGPRRAAEVAAAWEGLLQIRAVLLDGAIGVPAPWERERFVHSVALALEAAGCPPARPAPAGGDEKGAPAGPAARTGGYTVTGSAQEGVAEVSWRGAATAQDAESALARCADLLDARGWQCTRHRARGGAAFLLASPRWGS